MVAVPVFLAAFGCAGVAPCAEPPIEKRAQPSRPKIGLALSGGGARGAAHIGVLRELERQRIPIDYIAGTSMGAVIGGLYAAGLATDEMQEVLLGIDWNDIFRDAPVRRALSQRRKIDDAVFQIDKNFGVKEGGLRGPTGFIQGRKLHLLLDRITASVRKIDHFDNLPIPFRAIATDLVTGEGVVLDSGNLATAIRASMSIPGALARVDINGRLLVDGGIANNLPVDVVRRMGADVVVAVDISTPLFDAEKLGSVFAIISQLTGFLTRKNTEQQIASLTKKDVFIVPELGDIETGSFKRAGDAVPIGEAAVVAASAKLAPYALNSEDYESHIVARRGSVEAARPVEFVRIQNRSGIGDDVIRARLRLTTGEPLDVTQLEEDLGVLYGLGLFETVTYDVVTEDERRGVVISVTEKSWGPRYLQFGARFSSDFGGGEELGLIAAYTITPINRLGGEWRATLRLGQDQGIATELFQPVGLASPYFVRPTLFYLNQKFNEIAGGNVVAVNRVERVGAGLALGRDLGTWGRLSTGLRRATGDVSQSVGPSDEETEFDEGQVFAAFQMDTLDNVNFPTAGARGLLRWDGSRTGLGADQRFNQFRLDSLGAWTWGRHTLLLGARYFTTDDGEVPIQNQFRTGGLFELPGFTEDELTGRHLVLLRSGYQRALSDLLGFPRYVGLTLQLGNVFEDADDISFDNALLAGGVYLGLDTLFGPFYLAYGLAEGGENTLYVLLGTQF